LYVNDANGTRDEKFRSQKEAVDKYNQLCREAIRDSNSKTPVKVSPLSSAKKGKK
jgi:hypothetical protein